MPSYEVPSNVGTLAIETDDDGALKSIAPKASAEVQAEENPQYQQPAPDRPNNEE